MALLLAPGSNWILSGGLSAWGATSSIEEPEVDPFFNNVSLLLHMDGSFTDASTNTLTVTANGGAAISTTDSKFGSGCALLDGSGDYLGVASSALFNVGGGTSFTVECFVRRNGTSAGAFLSMRNTAIYAPFELISTGSNVQLLSANAALNSWSVNAFSGSDTLPLGEYAHVALVGDSASLKVYINGTQFISVTQAAWASANYPLYIGGGGDNQFNGRIDEVRFTLNVARYTANFTPPTAPFPDSGPAVSEDYYASWVQQNYIWYPESYPPWWG